MVKNSYVLNLDMYEANLTWYDVNQVSPTFAYSIEEVFGFSKNYILIEIEKCNFL